MARKKLRIIQSILIDKDYAPKLSIAKAWVKEFGASAAKSDSTKNFWRFRQHDPSLFDPKTFRTHHQGHGVMAVVAKPLPAYREHFLSLMD